MDILGEINRLLSIIPEWLGGAIVAAIIGSVGYLYKNNRDAREKSRQEAKEIALRETQRTTTAVERLEDLNRLLEESESLFVSQNFQRNRLTNLLFSRLKDESALSLGYDQFFFQSYEQMIPEELELFTLIRGLTLHSMHASNARLRDWVDNNKGIRQLSGRASTAIATLDNDINQLKTHLSMWFTKYEEVFVKDERRSLVYLGDEKNQGVPFPTSIKRHLLEVITEMNNMTSSSEQ